jgi:hypothetical protein
LTVRFWEPILRPPAGATKPRPYLSQRVRAADTDALGTTRNADSARWAEVSITVVGARRSCGSACAALGGHNVHRGGGRSSSAHPARQPAQPGGRVHAGPVGNGPPSAPAGGGRQPCSARFKGLVMAGQSCWPLFLTLS